MEPTIQRWSAKRKVELLLQLIRGEAKLVDVCREHDLKQSEVEGWMDTFAMAGERGLKANAEDEVATHAKELKELRAKVGELVLELDARKHGQLSTAGTRRPSDVAERDAPGRQPGVAGEAVHVVWGTSVDGLLHDPPPGPGGDRCGADDVCPRDHRGEPDVRRAANHDRAAPPSEPADQPEDRAPHREAPGVAGVAEVAGEATAGRSMAIARGETE